MYPQLWTDIVIYLLAWNAEANIWSTSFNFWIVLLPSIAYRTFVDGVYGTLF